MLTAYSLLWIQVTHLFAVSKEFHVQQTLPLKKLKKLAGDLTVKLLVYIKLETCHLLNGHVSRLKYAWGIPPSWITVHFIAALYVREKKWWQVLKTPNCNRRSLHKCLCLLYLCMCGMQTGSEKSAITLNKGLHNLNTQISDKIFAFFLSR